MISQIQIQYSEELNPIDARANANYELRRAVNGIFGDADDIIYNLVPTYNFNSLTGASVATLNTPTSSSPLVPGNYRLTVRGTNSASVHDSAGNRLDGNRDGVVSGTLADLYQFSPSTVDSLYADVSWLEAFQIGNEKSRQQRRG